MRDKPWVSPWPALGVLALAAVQAPSGAQAPTLVPAVLRTIAPAGTPRGGDVTFTLAGVNVSGATAAVFDDPAITGTPAPGADRNQVKVTARVGPDARVGVHQVFLHTPLGTTAPVPFAVGGWPEVAEAEPNDAPGALPPVSLPATFTGTLDRVGDTDSFRFRAEAGQELVFEVVAGQIRSRLQSVLALLDESGRVLAEARGRDGRPDAVLGYRFSHSGTYALRIRDFENAGGADVTYRVNAGAFAYATHVFPLGVPRAGGEVTVAGFNLREGQKLRLTARETGASDSVTLRETPAGPLLNGVRLAVGEERQVLEREPNDAPSAAQVVAWPAAVEGRISGSGMPDADTFRFTARKGQRLVLEVQARRFGSPLDPVVEVLDRRGGRIERATLRPVAETATTLNDRDSAATGMRLLSWKDLAIHDLVYTGGELLQVAALPRGPDDDLRFRSFRGQRLGLLDTTPTAHAVNSSVYKVQVHPPGCAFPPNGMPLFRLYYRNDDGGPLYGKDSRLTFVAPEDGEYLSRIADVRGEGGEAYAYRLLLRDEQPDFRLSLNPESPTVPAGAAVPVEVTLDRLDGFDGPVDVRLEGLPPGISAAPTTVEAGETSASLLLRAEPDARTADPGPVRLVGMATGPDGDWVRSIEPAGGRCRITVLPKADLTVRTAQQRLTIAPGTEQHIEASITRENGFAGRVPIDLKNLPFGVRVLDVGLNGVLITESEQTRRFTLVCEPWVKPTQRLVYCTVRTETESSAPTEVGVPILLEVAR